VLLVSQAGPGVAFYVETFCIYLLLVTGLNISFGFGGQLALGQIAVFALGAYLAGYLMKLGINDVLLVSLACGIAGAAVGGLVGLPGLRVGAWGLAMLSFLIVSIVPDLVQLFEPVTGGTGGLLGIPAAKFVGQPLGDQGLLAVAVAVCVGWFLLFRNLVKSHYGLALRLIGRSNVLARSQGMSVFRLKTLAYTTGMVPAGLAGALLAYLDQFVGLSSFSFNLIILVLAASVLGGSTSVYGAIIGGLVVTVIDLKSAAFVHAELLAYGGMLLLAGTLFAGGVTSALGRLKNRLTQAISPTWTTRWELSTAFAAKDKADRLGPADGSTTRSRESAGPLPERKEEAPTLVIRDVSKSFGGVRALDAVTADARPGQITAIVGGNGAGKTTLLNILAGIYRPDSGSALFEGKEITGLPQERLARMGVGRTFQTPIIPNDLSCAEVVESGRLARAHPSVLSAVLRTPKYRRWVRQSAAVVRDALALVGLDGEGEHHATDLPAAGRRLVELARCWASGARVLLLDEPASGLEADALARLRKVLMSLRDRGFVVILVEHNVDFVFELADHVIVMDNGKVIEAGTSEHVLKSPVVARRYFGTVPELSIQPQQQAKAAPPTPSVDHESSVALVRATQGGNDWSRTTAPLLKVEGVRSGYGDLVIVSNAGFEVRAGELVVLAGPNGAGKSTLAKATAGILRSSSGTITLSGRDITGWDAEKRLKSGLGVVLDSRRVFPTMTVEQNLRAAAFGFAGMRSSASHRVAELLEEFPVLASRRRLLSGSLSGGQQQLLVLVRAMVSSPRVLILDEPFAGLAPAIVAEMRNYIEALASRGIGVAVFEELGEERMQRVDRRYLMRSGVVEEISASSPSGTKEVLTKIN
jgi:branched-chain amino acid transport system permease protein